jgi:predicted DCC family thiol-disulfide oxidoreductase YuxK
MPPPILLYDGVCGLCNRLVQFVLRRDRKVVFRFAALQSTFATPILQRHGASATDLDTVFVVLNYNEPGETLVTRSAAVVFVLRQMGILWRSLAAVANFIPRPIGDAGYRFIARRRYRIFGRYDACPLSTPETRARFLDQ